MQYVLNKIGECGGCIFFNRQYDHEKCRYCERNPVIASVLKDNKTKADKDLVPDDAFTPEQRGELDKVPAANKEVLAEMGVAPGAVDSMFRKHDQRGPPSRKPR